MSSIAQLLDSQAGERVVVFGSLPPVARDIDLVARPAAGEALERCLHDHGFVRSGHTFARFRGSPPDAVELMAVESWGLPEREAANLFEQARPLPGLDHLARPSPHHVLLVVALKLAHRGQPLTASDRDRIDAALVEEPGAFEAAARLATAWRARRALALLRREYERNARPGRLARSLAQREHDGGTGLRSLLPLPRILRGALFRRRRGALITFSGLDGSGKSTQSGQLRESLEWLGCDTVVIWRSLVNPPAWLSSLAGGVKRLLGRGRSGDPRPPGPSSGTAGVPMSPDQPGRLSNLEGWRGSVAAYGWSSVIALRLAVGLARATWPPLLRGKVVICDRYLLDAWVELLYFYGGGRRFGAHLALMRALAPAPRLEYLIDVSVETATARKADFSHEQNQQRAAIYRECAASMGVRRLDGDRELGGLAEEIGAETWASL